MRIWNGHVDLGWLEDFQSGQLSEKECQTMLEHIGKCDFCAEKLADFLEKDLLAPPAYFQEEVLKKTHSLNVQAVKIVHCTSKKMRLFLYSLKVSLALAASLFLLFVTAKVDNMEMRLEDQQTTINETLNKGSSSVGESLRDLTDWLFQKEFKEE